MAETLVILDYGSQYTQLIGRRVRELGVYSTILPFDAGAKRIATQRPKGIILSGGPSSIYDAQAPTLSPAVLKLGVPVLGICYGLQLLTQHFDGTIEASSNREYGKATLQRTNQSLLLKGLPKTGVVWMSHGDRVAQAPADFHVTAKSGQLICAIEEPERKIFGLQFHPEVSHTAHGATILKNFLNICGFAFDWSAASIIGEQVERVRQVVGNSKVICALSGGVDSTVAATLVDKAIGSQQTCIFVDTGLLRQDEYDEVLAAYAKVGLNVVPVRAGARFLRQLKGVVDPERKRKIIGAEFIKVFEEAAGRIEDAKFLVQGTLYPDVIESVSTNGPSATIKSHHNVGGLPEHMKLQLIEPLRQLFKDEVRAIGRELGLPDFTTQRQPFPGPGLAVRIIGAVTPERIMLLQRADAIVRNEIERSRQHQDLWQFFAVLLPVKSVGVMGDNRTYEQVVALRVVESADGMTADWAHVPHSLLAKISSRIISEVKGVNRVVYDITSKPPGTIEWE